jgi:two-component system NtrC family sensor kinase
MMKESKIDTLAFVKDLLAKKLRNSLSLKLIVAIGTLILVASGIFWFVIIVRGEKQILNSSIIHASEYNSIIENSVKTNMSMGQVEIIQKMLEEIGTTGAFKEVRIYSHPEGIIKFSSDKAVISEKLDIKSPSCAVCHKDTEMKNVSWSIIKRKEGRILRLSKTLLYEPTCSVNCHYHTPSKKIIGILETDYSIVNLDKTLREQKLATITFGIILTVVSSIVLCIILWKIIIKPLMLLAEGMERVSKGDLDHKVEINTRDEMGMLAKTFNSMTTELKTARQRLENWAKELEEEVAKKTEEIRKGQEQMIHTEKLASLGRMAAGVAHELNSPLTGIVTFAHLMLKRIPPEDKLNREDLEVIIEQAERCSKIIKGLLGFSRALPTQKAKVNINATISHVLDMIKNQAKFHNIKLITDLAPDLPEIDGDASQLEQVYMNLLINAADAMNDRGQIKIATRRVQEDGKEFIEIEFTDTGPGIPEEHLNKIFEPFFTTKPVGKGTGLGLSVSHGIIRKHGGYMTVKSKVGEGTSFFIRLPIPEKEKKEQKD